MISTFLLTAVCLAPPTPAPVFLQEAEETKTIDHATRMAEAGEDVAKLWALVEELSALDMNKEAREVCDRILEIDENHEEAHKKLRHHFYDDKWFTSYTALSKYRREEAKRMKDEFGLVRFRDEWVPEADVAFLRMGWTKTEDGEWQNPSVVAMDKQIASYLEEGRQQRTEDGLWISPEDFPKWQEGLFDVGEEEWVDKEKANEFHSQIYRWWQWQGSHFVCLSTLDYDSTHWAVWYADSVYDDLVRIVGVQPKRKPELVVLNSVAQYNAMAGGDQAAQIQGTEQSGWSSIHYAFFADTFFMPPPDPDSPPIYRGTGVAYWDKNDETISPYGQFAIRNAAAHAYLEAIDPSWNAISEAIGNQGGGLGNFWQEKKIDIWLRYGIASYCERFSMDENAGDQADPWWRRAWAFEQIRVKENILPLETIFAFNLDLNDIPGSQRLMQEAGLLVSFMMDGPSDEVRAAHEAWKGALKTMDDAKVDEATAALRTVLAENEKVLRSYVGL